MWWRWCLMLRWKEDKNNNITKSFVSGDLYTEGFWQTGYSHRQPGGGFDYGRTWHHSQVETNTHIPTHRQRLTRRQRPCDSWRAIYIRSTHYHADNTHTHTLTLFRDMGPVLTTAKLTWRWSDRSVPRKAKRTRERAGAFVFVECHTSSRGEPVTGPGRPLKLWEGCVGIASVATSDVNSNILIAGCFLD